MTHEPTADGHDEQHEQRGQGGDAREPFLNDRHKREFLDMMRADHGEQWVRDNWERLEAEWEYIGRPGEIAAPVPRLAPPGQDPPGHA
jgi:hypothetical protein